MGARPRPPGARQAVDSSEVIAKPRGASSRRPPNSVTRTTIARPATKHEASCSSRCQPSRIDHGQAKNLDFDGRCGAGDRRSGDHRAGRWIGVLDRHPRRPRGHVKPGSRERIRSRTRTVRQRDAGSRVQRRKHADGPTDTRHAARATGPMQTLHARFYDPEDGKLSRADVPFWLIRAATSLTFLPERGVSLTVEEIEKPRTRTARQRHRRDRRTDSHLDRLDERLCGDRRYRRAMVTTAP